MRSVRNEALDCIRGAISIERGARGAVIHRTAPGTRVQLSDPGLSRVSAMPAGVRLDAITDAVRIEFQLSLPEGQPGHDLFIDVVVEAGVAAAVPLGEQLTVELGPTPAQRHVEVWLPTGVVVEIVDVRIPEGAALAPAPDARPLWVHHGGSISQSPEVARPTEAWPVVVARGAGRNLINLGLAGQCQLDRSIASTIGDLGADAISLELGSDVVAGVSMNERTFTAALHGFLDTIRETAPQTPVVVVSPAHCGPVEDRPGPLVRDEQGQLLALERPGGMSLRRVRDLIARHVGNRIALGDEQLSLVDGLELLGEADAAGLPDPLHPDAAAYSVIAERFRTRLGW